MNPDDIKKEICWIVAGRVSEFDEYVRKKRSQYAILRQECPYDYRYVSSVDSLRGQVVTRGFYIGSWRDRTDIKTIQEAIALCKRQPRLDDASTAAIEAAAKRLAAEIDAQVIDNLTKKFAPRQP